ncbi:MAG: hypothetical protein OEU32_05670 [Acidimicrobiia bacterium]|nr:hypothetical protein [Acidimicrobiia bacterium]
MTTWCFQCGADYDDSVTECVECAAPTLDLPPTPPEQVGTDDEPQLAYELHAWSMSGRARLDEMLRSGRIQHSWMGATLIIREDDEGAVDEAVGVVEEETRPTMAEGAEVIEYSLEDYPAEYRERLITRLDMAGIAHQIERDSELLVEETNEAEVDRIFEQLATEDPDRFRFGPGIEGVDPHAVVTDLFVATDRLRRNGREARGRADFMAAHDLAVELALPYGYDANFWRKVLDDCERLRDLLDADEDDDTRALAEELRNLLQQVV